MVMLPTNIGAVAGGAPDLAPLPASYGANPTSATGASNVDPATALAQQWSYLTGLGPLTPTQQDPSRPATTPTTPIQNSFTPMRIQ